MDENGVITAKKPGETTTITVTTDKTAQTCKVTVKQPTHPAGPDIRIPLPEGGAPVIRFFHIQKVFPGGKQIKKKA